MSEEERVRETLRRYEAAYASLSVGSVRSVFPSVSARLQETFDDLSSYSLAVKVQKIAFSANGATATVSSEASHSLRTKAGRSSTQVRSQTFTLQKQANGWVITQIR